MEAPCIVIAGGTGFIGSVLQQKAMDKGWQVRLLIRDKTEKAISPDIATFLWNPQRGKIDETVFDGADYVVNLAGATIFQPWTKRNKALIRDSRLDASTLLYNTIKTNNFSIKAYLGASAIGVYANEQNYQHSESQYKPNPYFLGELVHAWEQGHKRFEQLGIATSIVRFGLVLGNQGGFLGKQTALASKIGWPYFGKGEQWQSWIHLDDLVDLICFVLENQAKGVINAVAPETLSQRELMQNLAEHFPLKNNVFGIPSWLIRLGLGPRADLFLDSNNVKSEQLSVIGFAFRYPSISSAAQHLGQTFRH